MTNLKDLYHCIDMIKRSDERLKEMQKMADDWLNAGGSLVVHISEFLRSSNGFEFEIEKSLKDQLKKYDEAPEEVRKFLLDRYKKKLRYVPFRENL